MTAGNTWIEGTMIGSAGTLGRITAQTCIAALTVGCLAISASANYAWGITQGSDTIRDLVVAKVTEAELIGFAGLVADGLAATFPTASYAAWVHRQRGLACIFGGIALIAILWVGTGLLGFFTSAKNSASVQIDQSQAGYAMLESEMKRLEARRRMVPDHRPANVVAARISEAEGDIKFTRSQQCKNVTLPDSRIFCDNYWGLQSERAASDSAAELDEKIRIARNNLMAQKKVASIDTMADSLSMIAGIDPRDTNLYRPVFQALLILLAGSFGFTAIMFLGGTVQAASTKTTPPVQEMSIEVSRVVPPLQIAQPLPVVVPPVEQGGETVGTVAAAEESGQAPDAKVKPLPRKPVTAEEGVERFAKTLDDGWNLLVDIGPRYEAYCTKLKLPRVKHLGATLKKMGYEGKKMSSKGGKTAYRFPIAEAPAKAKAKA